MGFVELSEGTDGLRSRAVQLSAEADDFAAKLQSLLGRIQAVEAGAPWGGDQYGEAFQTSYNQPTDAGPFHTAVDQQAAGLGPEASDMGTALTAGAADYQIQDLQSADDINGLV